MDQRRDRYVETADDLLATIVFSIYNDQQIRSDNSVRLGRWAKKNQDTYLSTRLFVASCLAIVGGYLDL